MALEERDAWLPRIHFFEVADQDWFPQTLREKVQDYLTLVWINKLPGLQPFSPAELVSNLLSNVFGERISDYVYVDFASGAGGPTPYIEKHLNKELRAAGKGQVKFVLTDIRPHVTAWERLAKKSENLTFIPKSVDATSAPSTEVLLKGISGLKAQKVMRLFSLAFHHFDDDVAADVLENTVKTSDGFCIFELQARDFISFILVSLLWPLAIIATPLYFLDSPGHLFYTYILPIVPFIWVWDGYISILRTRTPKEIRRLLEQRVSKEELASWRFKSGRVAHTWPLGYLGWVVCYKEK